MKAAVKVSVVNGSANALPQYATVSAAGMDLRASLEAPLTVGPGERILVPTGLRVAVPEGYELQLRPRSGLALRDGITLLNSPGTIDADYRGEIGVIIINHSDRPFSVAPGERICQMVLAECPRIEWVEVESLDDTVRGDGGFGHSGKQ